MENFRWNTDAAPELLVKYGFQKAFGNWIYDLVIEVGGNDDTSEFQGTTWYECIGTLILNSDGSIEAAGAVDEDLIRQLFIDGILYETK